MQRYANSEPILTQLAATDSAEVVKSAQKLSELGISGEALSRVGGSLWSILTGKIDPLSLLLEDDLLHRLYLHDEFSSQCCSHLITYFQRLSFKKPAMAILEIGAGTGGTTLPLLRSLRGDRRTIKQYDYTDISSRFFNSARSLFSPWSDFMRFKTLDIERDPVNQGFEGTYDLIIASNVLHATSRLDDTLRNVRKLLKPEGRLVLIEVTRLVPYLNIVAGVLPGWWKGKRTVGKIFYTMMLKYQFRD